MTRLVIYKCWDLGYESVLTERSLEVQEERTSYRVSRFVKKPATSMKVLVYLVGLFCLSIAKPPTVEQVRNAIMTAKETSTLKRDLPLTAHHGTRNTAAKCPMTMYHGTRKSDKVEGDMRANDLLRAARMLIDAGFTDEELRSEHVINEFRRQAGSRCPEETVECDENAKYRSIDGKCNNLNKPVRGSAGVPQRRLLPPAYDDGISSPRTKSVVPGEFLPSARLVSNEMHRGNRRLRSDKINLHVFQMGQFLDHDIIATPIQAEIEDCCTTEADVENCMPIRISWDDDPNPHFFNGYCMNFPRSAPEFCPTVDGSNRREQINVITSFVDASNVYGSSDKELAALRDGAFMATEAGNRLPNEPNDEGCIPDVANGIHCSAAGDHRVNVIPSLNAYHALWVREHNRIAKELQSAFTDEEELFQEARRILIAVMQKVVYDEFLPTFISEGTMMRFRLLSTADYRYNPEQNPTVINEFGISYRLGHTWIPRRMNIFNRRYRRIAGNLTEFTFFDPSLTYFDGAVPGLDGLALGLGAKSFATDRIIESAARDFLFLDAQNNSFDLAALNIQRGRDHGLASYVDYRVFCGLDETPIARFQDLPDHTRRLRRKLRNVYSNVGDIDLFTGGLSETPVEDGTVGPLFECILGRQFRSLKFGDRFWYQGDAAGFSTGQLQAIEKYTMAKVLCNNFEFRTVNFPNAFLVTDDFTNCDMIPDLDITPFLPANAVRQMPNNPTEELKKSLSTLLKDLDGKESGVSPVHERVAESGVSPLDEMLTERGSANGGLVEELKDTLGNLLEELTSSGTNSDAED